MIVETYEDVIKLTGRLRTNQWETLHTAISLSLKRHPEGVILDCGGLTEATREGAQTFTNVMEFLDHHDARVIVAAVPDQVMAVLRQVEDVRSQLPISPSVEEARKSLYFFTGGEVEDDHGHKKKKELVRSNYNFLVCVMGGECDNYVLTTARKMARGLQANVSVMFPLIIPRDMPLQAALPEEEELAREALLLAEKNLEEDGVGHVMILERGRDVASAIVSALEEHPSTHVILGLPGDDAHDQAGRLVRSVLDKVQRSAVIFVRGPVASG